MVAYTVPLAIPYPESTDALRDAVSTIPQAAADKVDDLLSALSAVNPSALTNLPIIDFGAGTAYVRRAGMTTLHVNAARASWDGTTRVGVLPVGFRPLADVGFFCLASANNSPIPMVVLTNGTVRPVQASSGLNGVFGTVTFAC